MRKKHPVKGANLSNNLRVRLFRAAAEIDVGDDIRTDSKGPASPYEQMYERHGVSDKRPRRQR